MKDTALQLLKEFWAPLLAALAWAGYGAYDAGAFDARTFTGSFAAAFFFVAWATSQFFRVRKQKKVETDLSNISGRLAHVADRMREESKRLIDTVTGGGSFCYVVVGNFDSGTGVGQLMLLQEGDMPLYDVRVEIINLDACETVLSKPGWTGDDFLRKTRVWLDVGNLIPGTARPLLNINLSNGPKRGFTIGTYARNGSTTQMLRFYHHAEFNHWAWATRVLEAKKDGKTLYEHTKDFPTLPDGSVDWDVWRRNEAA